jgi:hypothetical protein
MQPRATLSFGMGMLLFAGDAVSERVQTFPERARPRATAYVIDGHTGGNGDGKQRRITSHVIGPSLAPEIDSKLLSISGAKQLAEGAATTISSNDNSSQNG